VLGSAFAWFFGTLSVQSLSGREFGIVVIGGVLETAVSQEGNRTRLWDCWGLLPRNSFIRLSSCVSKPSLSHTHALEGAA
jgi:hypothetical protein